MPRPSYKTLYEEEKSKRERAAEIAKGVMRNEQEKVKELADRVKPILEGMDDSTRDLIYLERISELQTEVRRLKGIIDELAT